MATLQPAASSAATQHASFHGSGGSLFGITIVNIFLTILTLGIYSFWGRVRVRRYLYSQTDFAGDRFAYHGTGKELLIGFLKVLLIFALLYAAFFAAVRFVHVGVGVALIYISLAALIPLALYGSMRYAMSRTSWRGIRFSFRGSLGACYREYLGGLLLTILTLGIYVPFYQARMRRYWSGNTYFGNTPFVYDGSGKDLIGHFLLAIVLTIPTLYLYWVWYAARQMRYHWSHTSFSRARFSSSVSGGSLLWLSFSNVLLLIFTLGLALPWILVRNIKFILERTAIDGQIDWKTVMADASAPKVGATGELLADGLDVGVVIN